MKEMADEAQTNSKDSSRWVIKCKKCQISINRALIPLKALLFLWYGASSILMAFTVVLYKQRGITLTELSVMTIASPIAQLFGSTISGIIADKVGSAKTVLVGNMLLVMSTTLTSALLPKLHSSDCNPALVEVSCRHIAFNNFTPPPFCDSLDIPFEGDSIKLQCAQNFSDICFEDSLSCTSFKKRNMSITLHRTLDQDNCSHANASFHVAYKTIPCCYRPETANCNFTCVQTLDLICSGRNDYEGALWIAFAITYILHNTFYSNVYRCFDAAVMSLIKEHGSDFGHERFFSISGVLILSPFAGILVDAATTEGGERNYASVLYYVLVACCILLVIIYKLPVRLNPPGEKLGKKSIILLKNPDVVMFSIVVFVLGISWNSTELFIYWFLEDLKASGTLMALTKSVKSLFGLPFLFTSKWWIKKIGTQKIFPLALLAYVACFIGYSFLNNPWFALILEFHGVLTYHLLWVAVVIHSHDIAPEGLRSTVITCIGAIHYGGGKAASGLVGGLIMSKFGNRIAFRLSAIICLVASILYAIYLFFRHKYLKAEQKRTEGRHQDEKGALNIPLQENV